MTKFEQTLLDEVATLPESRQETVLAYVRFLKLGLNADKHEIIERFEKSWARVRERTSRLNITEQDIEAEIRAVRQGE